MARKTKAKAKPVIFFIHGSWHNERHFYLIRDHLTVAGFDTECPVQPSYGASPDETTDFLAEDVKVVTDAIQKLLDQGRDVIVVMHSYGVVGTQAVHEDFSKKARAAKGLSGGVTQLLYLCAFIIPEGTSLVSALGGELPAYIEVKDGSCMMLDPQTRFFNDMPRENQDDFAGKLRPVPYATQTAKISYTAYKHYPVTYLFCENDKALPLPAQQMMVKQSGAHFKTLTCDAGHSPHLSRPSLVADLIERMAKEDGKDGKDGK